MKKRCPQTQRAEPSNSTLPVERSAVQQRAARRISEFLEGLPREPADSSAPRLTQKSVNSLVHKLRAHANVRRLFRCVGNCVADAFVSVSLRQFQVEPLVSLINRGRFPCCVNWASPNIALMQKAGGPTKQWLSDGRDRAGPKRSARRTMRMCA